MSLAARRFLLIGFGISFVIAVIGFSLFFQRFAHNKQSAINEQRITVVATRPAPVPVDLGVFLAPDLKRVKVWG